MIGSDLNHGRGVTGMQHRDERLPADVAIRVFHGDRSYRATVANVSTGGARLSGVGGLPAEAQVTLLYLHLCVRARVAWSEEDDTGVRFLAPLDPAELQVLQDAAAFSLSRMERGEED